MITVIADDLTGAAELGGIGLRYGLTVEITTSVNTSKKSDLLIIAADTRSMTEAQAIIEMSVITISLNKTRPDLIFKKVDSVLRGHVIAELNVHMEQFGFKKALLVPANPALGRTLTNGNYFIHGQPIHLTGFSNDPDFAINSSSVLSMLRIKQGEAHIRTSQDELPQSGLTIGECTTNEDLEEWVKKIDNTTLLAGGAGFFTAILEASLQRSTTTPAGNRQAPALFVCGSTFNKSKQIVERVNNYGGPVSYMPNNIVKAVNPAEHLYEKWTDEVVSLLKKHQKAIVAIHEDTTKNLTLLPGSLREKQAVMVKKVFQKTNITELLIEGGATAAAIIKQLNINRLFPVKELSPGVIRMRAGDTDDLFLTLKPGSYDWPAGTWDF